MKTTIISGRIEFQYNKIAISYYVIKNKIELCKANNEWGHNMNKPQKIKYINLCKEHYEELKKILNSNNIYLDD